jgi:adenylate kinase
VRTTLIGIQASGKGTFGRRLANDFDVPHIEIGEVLRERAKVDDEVGRSIAKKQAAGEFADEAVVVQSLAEALAEAPRGFVLDGFPRLGRQVDTLDAMLARLGVCLDAPIYLELSDDEARERIANRLVCNVCKRSTTRLVSDEGGPCPVPACDGKLTHRRDDRNRPTVDKRLQEFHEFTMPIVEEYRRSGRLIEIDVSRNLDAAYAELRAQLVART